MSVKSKIQALITAANTKTGETDTTLTDAVQTLVDGYGEGAGGDYDIEVAENEDGTQSWAVTDAHGGTEITDGIVVKAINADGYATEVDIYGTDIPKYLCGTSRTDNNSICGYSYVEKVNIKSNIVAVNEGAFKGCGINANGIAPIEFLHLTSIGTNAFSNSGFTVMSFPVLSSIGNIQTPFGGKVTEIYMPKCTTMLQANASYGYFRGQRPLTTVEVGSIGYPISANMGYQFRDCTQSGLTITIYTTGDVADTRLAAIRTYATNATIIVKASEDTTYNGVSYSSGDTMITSEVA